MTLESDVVIDSGSDAVVNDDRIRERVMEAAVAEFAASNFGEFTLEAAAARAGVELLWVKQTWASSAGLLTEALRDFGARHMPLPDTGTLRGDLLDYAKSYAAMVSSPMGRRLVDSVIVKPEDWDLSASRPTYLEKRDLRMADVIQRGIARGECSGDIDPVRVIDLIETAVCLPIMLYDRPILDEDCEFVVDTILNGISPRG